MRPDNVFEEPTSPPAFSAIEAPKPTARFRRRAWLEFQRALDPLAPPKASLATPATRAAAPSDR
jgi:hypothetical protein